MKHIGSKLFIGFICMAALTVGLLWLIQAVFMKDNYLNERVRTINEAIENNGADYSKLESDLNISILALDSGGNAIYMSQGLPMRGMMLRQIPSMFKNTSNQLQYLQLNGNEMRYAVLGNILPDKSVIYAVFSLVDVDEASRIILKQLWIITAALFVFSVVLAFVLSRLFSRPIRDVTSAAHAMAEGNLDISLPVRSKDETGQLTAALNNLGNELRKTENLKRELIANVSHELRSPLSVIQGFAETVRDVTWPDEQKRTTQLTVITEEAKRLSNIVNDILDYSRLQAGVDSISVSDFDVCPAMQAITARYEIEAAKKHISLDVDCDNLLIRFDKARFTQVVNNLLDNALNHASAGSKVYISIQGLDNAARISVKNTGSTIPPDDVKNIWERYYRSENISGSRPLGTGLGLSIVKSILDRHNVAYGVKSEDNETTFWFETQPIFK